MPAIPTQANIRCAANDRDGSIWLLPIVALLVFALTQLWFSYSEYQQAIEAEYRALESNARIAEAQVSGLLRNLQQLLTQIAHEQPKLTPAQRAAYDNTLADYKGQFPEIRSLVVINAAGRVELTATPRLKGFDSSQRDYFLAHSGKPLEPNFYVSRTFKTATGNDISIAFSVALRDSDGKLQGMVVSGIDPKYFESVLQQVTPHGPNTTAALFNRHGDVVYRVPNPERYKHTNVASSSVFQEHLHVGKPLTRHIGVSVADGYKRIYAISRVGDTGLSIGISRPFDSVLTDWRQYIVQRIVIFVLACMLIIWLTYIAQRQQRERKRAESEIRIAAVAFESQEGMMVTDARGTILRVNQEFLRSTGYSLDEVVGKNPSILKSGRHDAEFYRAMWETLHQTGTWQGEIWDRRKNGEIYPKWLVISAVKDEAGQVTHYIGTHFDITERKKAEEKINSLAFYDQLTGLPNRILLMDRLSHTLAATSRNGYYGALMFIDLDNFKTLNDSLGHDMGDQLLQQVAARLKSCLREEDTAARQGGDEFVVLLSGLSTRQEDAAGATESIADKILAELGRPYQLHTHQHRSTASIGVTLFRGHETSVDELMKQVDLAMYRAKASGRNIVRFFDPTLEAAIRTRIELENDFRRALDAREFLLHYQPQIDSQGRTTGAEALLRWQHPRRGMVSPAEFIPLAEETGLILPVGEWVLQTACQQLVAWSTRSALAELTIAVNVSVQQFRERDFVDRVLHIIRQTGANPQRLKLELTESLLVQDIEAIIEKMHLLKAQGIGFSLDDFGTGYSSLAYLKQLPLDQLKIDQSFVRDVLNDPNDAAIAKTIVALGQTLGLAVIAEGVETQEQRDFLASNGCHAYQGYFFSRPLPAEALEAQLLNAR